MVCCKWFVLTILFLAQAAMAAVAVEDEYAKASAGSRRHRMALIIGNSTYPADPLPNAARDALTMDDRLRSLGFSVERHLNLSENDFKQALRQFWARANRVGGDAVFFYAGHGVGIDGRNLLLPIDTDVKSIDGIRRKGIDLMDALGAQSTRLHPDLNRVVILDSCRNDPARRGVLNGQPAGFFVTDAPSALISFSTSLGRLALDGPDGANSYFTRNLARELLVDEIEASVLFTRVRGLVLRDTGGKQMPVEFNTLNTPFVFRSEPAESMTEEERQIKNEISARLSKGLSAVPDNAIGKATEELYRSISAQLELEENQRRVTEARLVAEERAKQARVALDARRKGEAEVALRQRLAADAEASRQAANARSEAERLAKARSQQVAELERAELIQRAEAASLLAEKRKADEEHRLADLEKARVEKEEKDQLASASRDARRIEEAKRADAAAAQQILIDEQRAAQNLADAESERLAVERRAQQAEAQLTAAMIAVGNSQRAMNAALVAARPPGQSRPPRRAADGAVLVRGVKLPPDLKVELPGPDVRDVCRAFSGGWGGVRWADVRTAEIWVESIASDCTLSVVYAFGGTSVTGSSPNFQRVKARVSNGEARVRLASGSVISLRPTRNNTLAATLQDTAGGTFDAEFDALDSNTMADDGRYAFEQRKTGVEGGVSIRATNLWKPIPDSAPGVPVVSTLELEKFLREHPNAVLIDALGEDSHKSIPRAMLMPDFGRVRLARAERIFAEQAIEKATSGDKHHPVVVFERNTRFGWLGYHAVLRLIGLGYTNIRWFRGGIDAWHDAGFAMQ